MSSSAAKQVMLAGFATVAKAAGHPHRVAILEQLAQGERSVEALARCAGLGIANASQHLQSMRQAGLVAARREGKLVLYRLADDSVLQLLHALAEVAERNLAEVREVVAIYFEARDSLEPVTRAELRKRLKGGGVTVLDVRPPDEFARGHLPGAINIPLKDLERRIDELAGDGEIVAYCRGRWCVLAFEAVAALRKHGLTARRLEDGLPEWRAARLPLETGENAAT
jgi:ArsR family transcriptional regulator